MYENDTIAAIATPPGVGGIAVIRVSGADAVKISDRVFSGAKKLSGVPSHTIHYGFIVNEKGERVDEVLVSVMLAPKTFTREDVVEISTHGGIRISRAVLSCLLFAGARLAEPGEFTKRAFLNGRIDLTQAEAVIDLIQSETELAGKNALSQAGGKLFQSIEGLRERLLHLAASMQVVIDYPDEDLEDMTPEEMTEEVRSCQEQVEALLKTAESGKVLREGIKTVIVGQPNVGKSSLLNCLAGEERAIVTGIAGTTRDVIEERVDLDGVLLRLLDTAGIRETEDEVERLGVERSRRSLLEADLVLLLLDAERGITPEDRKLLLETAGKNRILLLNKTDAFCSGICEWNGEPVLHISAKTGGGRAELSAEIKKRFQLGEIGQSDAPIITNLRHKQALMRCNESLNRMLSALFSGIPSDLTTIDLNDAISALGEISGASVSEDLVSAIFHQFCVGK